MKSYIIITLPCILPGAKELGRLGLKELVALGIGGMIGGGIFSSIAVLVKYAGPLAPYGFVLGGLIALLTSYSYAKFSEYHPCIGGTVEFLGLSFKNSLLLDFANSLLWIGYTVMIALYAYAFGSYFAMSLGLTEGTFEYVIVKHLMTSISLVLFGLINYIGVEAVGKVENVLVYAKVLLLLLFGVAGLLAPTRVHYNSFPPLYMVVFGGMMVFSAYEGFGIISNASVHVDSKLKLKLSYFLSVLIVMFIYVLIAYVLVKSVPPSEVVKYKDYALAIAAKPILGEMGQILVIVAALLSTSSAINATILGASRVLYLLKFDEKVLGYEKVVIEITREIAITTALALIIANVFDLVNISFMGSIAFLLIYSMVNLGALRIAETLRANRLILILANALSWASTAFLWILYLFKGSSLVVFTLFGISLITAFVFRAIRR